MSDTARPNPVFAVLLSLLLPGLGHLYAGRARAAVIWTLLTGALLPGFTLALFLPGVAGGLLYAASIPFLYIALLHSAHRAAIGSTGRLPIWAYVVFVATAVPARATGAVAIRTGAAAPLRIPTGSMAPALLPGDNVVSRVGALALPVERGQVITFRLPEDPSTLSVKRVVGMPGETVELRGGQLYLDGAPAPRARADAVDWRDQDCEEHHAIAVTEELGGRSLTVLSSIAGPLSDFGPEVVPDGHYFVLGDNRDDSADSRTWGAVPAQNVLGQVHRVWLSADPCGSPFAFRLDRLGQVL